MSYHLLDEEERSQIAWMKAFDCSRREIARRLGKAASTISRELRRNRYSTDGSYKALHAGSMARRRRRRARQGSRFNPLEWMEVEALLRQDYSAEQVSGRLRLTGSLNISHETIYRRVWADKSAGGTLYRH